MPTDIVGSKEPEFASQAKPDKRGYGENGFHGQSSDLPGEHTTSGFLPQTVIPPRDAAGTPNWQTRNISAAGYPPHAGMKPGQSRPTSGEKVPTTTYRGNVARTDNFGSGQKASAPRAPLTRAPAVPTFPRKAKRSGHHLKRK